MEVNQVFGTLKICIYRYNQWLLYIIMLISLKNKNLFPDLEHKKGSHTLQKKFHAFKKENMYRKF